LSKVYAERWGEPGGSQDVRYANEHVMRAVFCNLLSAALLIHAMFGCCWHDAHEAVAGEAPDASFAVTDGCHNHDRDADGHESHAPCKGHPNCHGLCNYLPAQKSDIGKCLEHALVVDFALDTNAACGSQVAAVFFAPGTTAASLTPPVRLHLFHQILLI
jgi:hypothetical protein